MSSKLYSSCGFSVAGCTVQHVPLCGRRVGLQQLKIKHESGSACDACVRRFYPCEGRVISPSHFRTGCFCRGALVSADPMTRWVSGCGAQACRGPFCLLRLHSWDQPPREENYRGRITRWKERKLGGGAHSRTPAMMSHFQLKGSARSKHTCATVACT